MTVYIFYGRVFFVNRFATFSTFAGMVTECDNVARFGFCNGKPFLNDYGWAADTLRNPNPTFASIEAAVDLDRLRPYFKLASNTVHAGAKGTFFRLGVLGDQDGILAGASNVGLQEAGRLAALSLTQITTVLLLIHPNTDSIIWSRVLGDLSSKVELQFVKVQRRIDREERQLRKGEA